MEANQNSDLAPTAKCHSEAWVPFLIVMWLTEKNIVS